MAQAVELSYAAWAQMFPELAQAVTPAQIQAYFLRPIVVQMNDTSSPIQDQSPQGVLAGLLYLLVSHLAVLGQRDPNQVGRISDASQGTVHVAFDAGAVVGSQAWFMQTRYGAEYWQATLPFRSATYRAPPQPFFIPPSRRPF